MHPPWVSTQSWHPSPWLHPSAPWGQGPRALSLPQDTQTAACRRAWDSHPSTAVMPCPDLVWSDWHYQDAQGGERRWKLLIAYWDMGGFFLPSRLTGLDDISGQTLPGQVQRHSLSMSC